VKIVLRIVVIAGALALIGLPVFFLLSGRDTLVLAFVAVALAGLCSFLAYRGAIVIRRRIDAIGEAGAVRNDVRKRVSPKAEG
jgi:hypothetical protein